MSEKTEVVGISYPEGKMFEAYEGDLRGLIPVSVAVPLYSNNAGNVVERVWDGPFAKLVLSMRKEPGTTVVLYGVKVVRQFDEVVYFAFNFATELDLVVLQMASHRFIELNGLEG